MTIDTKQVEVRVLYSHQDIGDKKPEVGFLLIIPHNISYTSVDQLHNDLMELKDHYNYKAGGQCTFDNQDYDIHAYAMDEDKLLTIFKYGREICETGEIFK